MRIKILSILYMLLIVFLFLYSFTQVDLGLTLTKASFWQVIQKQFQYIGYFQRPLSTQLYGVLIILLFLAYGLLLYGIDRKKITRKTIWILILFTAGVLTFSFNAFSHDFFNYVFDAKIVTYYHQDPYLHKALDYPGDEMLGFMHWTHRTYPYGPTWLLLTIPLSFIGSNIFLLTLILFKLMTSVLYLGTTYYIGKISEKLKPEDTLFNMAFFAFSPLVLIEGLVSAHNDLAMMFFALLAIHLLISNRFVPSFLALLLSIGVKFATVFLFPIFIAIVVLTKQNKKLTDLAFLSMVLLMGIGVLLAVLRTNFQPWYLLMVFPISALVAKKYYILIPSFILSIASLLQYIPYLFLGNWNPPVPSILSTMLTSGLLVSALIVSIYYFKKIR